jgi:DNA replication protein DnaC
MEKSPKKSIIPNLYDNVDLTQSEIDSAIADAKIKKYWQLKDERERLQKIELFKELTRPWSADELKKVALGRANTLVKKSGKEYFELDEFSQPVFDLLCLYFSNDPKFEEHGYSLHKGNLLIGEVGVGKTEMLRAFEYNKRQCFKMITCSQISLKVDENGSDYWKTYTGYIPGHGNTQDYYYQPNVGWLFDEFGTEEPINCYGTRVDPLFNIIQTRYNKRDSVPFSSLHMTSNLNGEMMQHRYGAHIRSRVREMFNVIKIDGVDRRK